MIPILITTILLSQPRQAVQHPAMGSELRTKILDVLRPYAYYNPTKNNKFTVNWFAVRGNHAVVTCAPESGGEDATNFSSEGNSTSCFLIKEYGAWKPKAMFIEFHEGFMSGEGAIIDLRELKTLGFTVDMFPGKQDDVETISHVRSFGFLFAVVAPKDRNGARSFKVKPSELPTGKTSASQTFLVKGYKCHISQIQVPKLVEKSKS